MIMGNCRFLLTSITLIWQWWFAQPSFLTTENLGGSYCQVIDMIFIILWRRLFQALRWELNQPQKGEKKQTKKPQKNWVGKLSLNPRAYVFNESNEFSRSILHLLKWITTNYGMLDDSCVCIRVCVCACVSLWLMFRFTGILLSF